MMCYRVLTSNINIMRNTMIIKYYTADLRTIIIDGVSDVHINANPCFGDFALDPWQVFKFDEPEDCVPIPKPSKVITYSKEGCCVLYVYNVAYVCNDDGKTIEKVVA